MQTNEATSAHTTPGSSAQPNRTEAEPAGPGVVVAGAEHSTKVYGSGKTTVQAVLRTLVATSPG